MGSKRDRQIPARTVTHTRNPAQRLFHTAVSLLGWLLFGYFWYRIFVRSLDQQALITILLILVVFGGIILVNFLWVHFNRSLYRRLGRRKQIRGAVMTPTADKLGRRLQGADWPSLMAARHVMVDLEGQHKVYRRHEPLRPVLDQEAGGPEGD